MSTNNLKKLLALFLALVMCLSLLPVSAFAEGEGDEADDPALIDLADFFSGPEDGEDPPAPAEPEPEPEPEDPAHEHAYEPVVTAPTCTEQGYTVWTCSCGDSYVTDETDPLGHKPAEAEEIPAEPGKPGMMAGVKCAVCGEVLEGCGEIPALPENSLKSVPSGAKGVVDSGTFGDGNTLTWSLDSNGLLTISGTGAIPDFRPYGTPWESHRRYDIKKLVINSGVTGIGKYAFNVCESLTSAQIAGSVTSIGEEAFSFCDKMTSVTLPDSITSIGRFAFLASGLTEVTIPSGMTQISPSTFFRCEYLKRVTIPVSVTCIGNSAFDRCPSLTDVYYSGTVRQWNAITFEPDNDALLTASLHSAPPIAAGACGAQGSNVTWELYGDGVLIISGTGEMADYAVGSQPWYAYRNMVTGVVIESGVTAIGSNAFQDCSSLAEVTVSETVTAVNDGAFLNCTSLTGIELPSGVTKIGISAFSGCRALTAFTVPARVTTLMNGTFSGCSGLNQVSIPSGVETICASVFQGCTSLEEITVPGHVWFLDTSVFAGCSSLRAVSIPAGVTEIRQNAFQGCSALEDVFYAGGSAEWNEIGIAEGNDALDGAFIYFMAGSGDVPIAASVFPDAPFRDCLRDAADTDGDGVLNSKEIAAVTALDVSDCGIASLEGIGVFHSLTRLNCADNNLTELDLSGLSALTRLFCGGNTALRTLNINPCPALVMLVGTVSPNAGSWSGEGAELFTDSETLVICDALLDALSLDSDYLLLSGEGSADTATLRLTGVPEGLRDYTVWRLIDENGAVVSPDDDDAPLRLAANGLSCSVSTTDDALWNPGCFYAEAEVSVAGISRKARCRIDVAEEWGQTLPEQLETLGFRLMDTKATVELYKTDYTRITVIPELSQNQNAPTAVNPVIVTPDPDSYGTNSGAAIHSARFADTDTAARFSLRVVDDRTLEIIPNPTYLTTDKTVLSGLKSSYSSAVTVTLAGGESFTTSAKLALSVKKTLPKLTAKAVKLNSFYEDTQSVVFTGSVPEDFGEYTCPDWFAFEKESRTITYTGEPSVKQAAFKLNLPVKVEGWAVMLPVAVSVSAAPTAPKLTLKPASVKLLPTAYDMAETAATITPAAFAGADITVKKITEGSTEYSPTDFLKLPVIVGSDGSSVRVFPGPAMPTDGAAHTYKVTLGVSYNGREGTAATLTVSLQKAQTPQLKLKSSGSIDLAVPHSPLTLVPTIQNTVPIRPFEIVRITAAGSDEDVKDSLFRVSGLTLTAKDALTARIPQGKQEVFTVNMRVAYGYDGDDNLLFLSADLTFTVKHSAKTPVPSVTLKATGNIDVLRPDSAVTVTPTIKNCYTHSVTKADLRIWKQNGKVWDDVTDTAADPFLISCDNGVFTLRLKENSGVNHLTDKFKLSFSADLNRDGFPESSPQIAVSVKMGTAKIAQSTKTVTLLKTDKYSRASVTLTLSDPTLAGIDWTRTVETFNASSTLYSLKYLSGNTVEICYREGTAPKAGTAKIAVFLIGNQSTKANATVSVSVKLA